MIGVHRCVYYRCMKEHLIGEFQSCDQGGIVQQPQLINCSLTTVNLTIHLHPPPPCAGLFLSAKNVAVEIVGQLFDSVAAKLSGKVIGTFTGKP